MARGLFIVAVVLQVAAQTFAGGWGAAVCGALIGVAVGVAGTRGGFRIGALSGALAAALLLAMIGVRGGDVVPFADRIGANFNLPGWGVLALSLLLPALQSGGLAGGIARLLRAREAEPAVTAHR